VTITEQHHIDLVRNEAVARVTVTRPEARNALTSAMRERLQDVFEELGRDREVRVVVLRGAGGKSFISGADIAEFQAQRTTDDFLAMARRDEELYRTIESLPQPTVAVIEGYAIGGGLMLAAVCDLRICTEDSKLGITSAKSLGNCLSPGMYARLAALLGPGRLKELLIVSELLPAQRALTWGLVNEVVARDQIEARVDQLTGQLASHAPLTMWAAKESVRRLIAGQPGGEDIMETVLGSADFQEGVAAFLEKRPPRWQNR
jgi:enoyl-CoA hydratase/carnithine racemase